MKQLWEATFKVDGRCSWNFYAASQAEAREEAITRFRNDPYWSNRYPETPAMELKQVTREAASTEHGDVGPSGE